MFWYSQVRKVTSDPVCLLIDSFSAHNDSLPQFEGAEYIFLLQPNVNSVFQPLDIGVLISLKKNARKVMLLRIIRNIENYD